MVMEENTTHVFASLYTFSDAAVHEILDQFELSSVARKAECEHEGNQFVIKCPKGDDHSVLAFIQLLQRYIQTELTRELDLFEESKLKRLPGTGRKTAGSDLEEARLNTQFSKIKVDDVGNVDSTDRLLINHESIVKKWNPAKRDERAHVGLNFNPEVLNQVGNLTSCRVELNTDGMGVLVRGESEQSVDKSIAKLAVLYDSIVCRSATCVFEYYIPEGDMDVLLQMVPLKETPGRKLSTTLLSPTSSHTKFLPYYLTIEMISQGGFDLHPKVSPGQRERKECKLWQGYSYKAYGDGSYNAEIYKYGPGNTTYPLNEPPHVIPAIPAVQTVDQWVEQSATAADDPFAPLKQAEGSPKVDVAADEPQVKPPPTGGRIRHVKTRKPKGMQGAPIAPPSVTTSVISDSTSRSPTKSGSKTGEGHDNRKASDSASTEPSIAGAVIPTRHLEPPPIEPPFMPEPLMTSEDLQQIAKAKWEARVVTDAEADISLLGFDPNESLREPPKAEENPSVRSFDGEESVQRVNEAETRQIRRTMNQQKAPTQVGAGHNALLKSMEADATQIVQYTRSFTGYIKLEVQLGRILVDHQTGSPDFKNQPFSPSQWSKVFSKQDGTSKLETVFTKMLTTTPTDADLIANLKLPSSRRLFEEELDLRKVTYLFNCKMRSGEELVVEVDEKGEFVIRSAPVLIGALNWHFPKREWDARLSVTSHGKLGEKYHEEAKSIVANLQISPSSDGTTLGLFTKTLTAELRIRSIILCRETCHYSRLYPDVLLHLKEMQDLGVWNEVGKKQEYHASARSQLQMANGGKLWWEAFLSSMTATEILKGNEDLEIGELTKWEAKEIIEKGLIKDLSALAKDIVTRIDSVGYYNLGPKAGSNTRTSDRVMKNAGFW